MTNFLTGRGNKLPHTRVATARLDAVLPITNAGDASLATAPSISPNNSPVRILATAQLSETLGGVAIFTGKLFRNGVELDVTDRFVNSTLSSITVSVSFEWTDSTPAANSIYEIRGISNVAAGFQAENRRITVRF